MNEEQRKEKYNSIKRPDKEFGEVTVRREIEIVWDKPEDWFNKKAIDYIDKGWEFRLPHQCDEWEIGSVEEAKEFLKNLQEAIKWAEQNP